MIDVLQLPVGKFLDVWKAAEDKVRDVLGFGGVEDVLALSNLALLVQMGPEIGDPKDPVRPLDSCLERVQVVKFAFDL